MGRKSLLALAQAGTLHLADRGATLCARNRAAALAATGRRILAVQLRRVRSNGGYVQALVRLVVEGGVLTFSVHECEETAKRDPYAVTMELADRPNPPDVVDGLAEDVTVFVAGQSFRLTAAEWRQVALAMRTRAATTKSLITGTNGLESAVTIVNRIANLLKRDDDHG